MTEDFFIHPSALEEYLHTLRYFASVDAGDRPELPFDFENAFNLHVEAIIENPHLHNVRRHGIRRANLNPRFGEYYIAYTIWREKIIILAIAHAKRRPYYWRKRIGQAKKMF